MNRFALNVAVAIAVVVVASALSLMFGSTTIGPSEVFSALFEGGTARDVVLNARLPRLLFALAVGGLLAMSGAAFQTLLRNPLADPYILGVSGGAALGATILMTLSVSGAYVGAMLGAGVVIAVLAAVMSWTRGQYAEYSVLLTGVMINAFCGSVILAIRSLISAQKSQEVLFFLIGTLDVEGLAWWDFSVVGVGVVLLLVTLLYHSRALDLMALGTVEAESLGVDVDRVRLIVVIVASASVALAIPFTGLIGFVGLVAPHFVRLLVGPMHIRVIPLSLLVGGAFLAGTDAAARASFHLFSSTLPVGAVTALIGAPLFLWFMKTGGAK